MNIFEKLIFLEQKAAHFGFKWEIPNQILSQIHSEIKEIEDHLKDGNKIKLQEEIGDLLHAVFSLCVYCQFDPEQTLKNSVDKFERRFNALQILVNQEGLDSLNGRSFAELMAFWDKAKLQSESGT